MASNTQFSIAVHLMTGLGYDSSSKGKTSGELSASVNACPSFVRRVVSKLSKAKLVKTTTGKSGACSLAKNPKQISLLDIYEAVEAPKAFAIHDYPVQKQCSISCNIKGSMERVLDQTQHSLEETLKKITLADVISDVKKV